MTHEEYIDKLNALQQGRGEQFAQANLETMKKLLNASKGNPVKFVALLKASRQFFLKTSVIRGKVAQREARRLGTKFAEAKLDTVD